MFTVAALFSALAVVHLLVRNVASGPAPWPHHTQEGFKQEISQISQAIEEAVATGSRSKRASGVSTTESTISRLTGSGLSSLTGTGLSSLTGTSLSSLTDTARCRTMIESMKQFWRLCYAMNLEFGGASLTCLRGPSMARTAVQSCARIVDGKEFDDLIMYATWLKDLKDEITTVV